MSTRKTIGRRELLISSALATGAITLAACTQAPPPPTPTKAPAPAAAAPSAPASPQVTAAPTKAPEPAKPAAEPTRAPAVATAAPPKPVAATATPEAKLGKQLIGKLEGPEVVTDPAKYPKSFKEAPALAELVKAGKLPPVKERIGEDPLVIKPVQEIGSYGGNWRRGFTGPGDKYNGYRIGVDSVLFLDYTGNRSVPNIARAWEVSPDGRTTSVFLRKGMKWSDGQPFTAEDFIFWFEDMYQNKDLVPVGTVYMTINGKPVTLEKVDTYTVRYKSPDPYYLLPDFLSSDNPISGQARTGLNGMGGYAPAHYLKQFHPRYVAKEELDKKVKDAKFDNWVTLFKFKNDWALNAELPVLTAWKTKSPINTPTWVLERNPYSIWVDTEGNQLPYIDTIAMTLAENLEVLNLRAAAGEYDWQERHVDLMKLPIFLENQSKGGYKVYLDPGAFGYDAGLRVNHSFEGDAEVARWLSNADFRRALALGIERDQFNEVFWLGMGTPGSVAPDEGSRMSPGPEYRKLWSTYDPKKASEMLDKMGLDKKDGEGYRLRTDGKGRLRVDLITQAGTFMPFVRVMEMIKEQWAKIGIAADVAELERSLAERRVQANDYQIDVRSNEGSADLFLYEPSQVIPIAANSPLGPLYGKWFASGGTQGKEPPARIRQAMDNYAKTFGVPEKEALALAKEIWRIVVEDQLIIGTVGLSPAINGVRLVKANLGNVPARVVNTSAVRTPSPAQPPTFYFKR